MSFEAPTRPSKYMLTLVSRLTLTNVEKSQYPDVEHDALSMTYHRYYITDEATKREKNATQRLVGSSPSTSNAVHWWYRTWKKTRLLRQRLPRFICFYQIRQGEDPLRASSHASQP